MKKYSVLISFAISIISTAVMAEQYKLSGFFGSGSAMGTSVQIEDNLAVVSVPGGTGLRSGSGLVVSFQFDGERWRKQADIFAEDGINGDKFGHIIKLEKNRLVVAAKNDSHLVDGIFYSNTGSVYIFELNENNEWIQKAKIIPNELHEYDHFGSSLALDGDRMLIGARELDENGGVRSSGTIYVYDLIDMQWQETEKITKSNTDNYFLGEGDLVLKGDLAICRQFVSVWTIRP